MRLLFLIDTKRRLIDNTPYDVFKLATGLRRRGVDVTIADLRHQPETEALADADAVYLFLETAGTWMCFDWDEGRYQLRIDQLTRRYGKVVVVGPQASAVRELVAAPIEAISELAFEPIIDAAYDASEVLDHELVTASAQHYRGEDYERDLYTLRPTVSVYHAMSCPMTCSFCFYAAHRAPKMVPWSALGQELAALCARGLAHFFFEDPNLLLDAEGTAALVELRASQPRFSYYCQVSPNALTKTYVERLRATGCRGMVIGIENESLIRFKGTVDGARRAVDRVVAAGMMPMLYFLVDGEHDVEAIAGRFADVPFRYSVLNRAFFSGRSLAEIRTGFAARAQLRKEAEPMIDRLRSSELYLDRLGAPAIQSRVGVR